MGLLRSNVHFIGLVRIYLHPILTRRSKWCVGHAPDSKLVHGLPHISLLEVGIALNLIGSDGNTSRSSDLKMNLKKCLVEHKILIFIQIIVTHLFQLAGVKVGHTNGFALSSINQLLHGFPQGDVIRISVKLDLKLWKKQ